MKVAVWIWILLLGGCSAAAKAQSEAPNDTNNTDTLDWNLKDSITMALAVPPFYSMWFDSRNSFVAANPVNVFGLRYGLSWGKISAYTGYYFSSFNQAVGQDSIQYKFQYLSSTYEYRFYKTHRFSLSGFAQLGGGLRTVDHKTNNNIANKHQFFMPLEFGAYGSVRFLRYIGVGGGLGTRIAFFPGGRNFSGPIYYLGFTAFPWTFYEDVRRKALSRGVNVP